MLHRFPCPRRTLVSASLVASTALAALTAPASTFAAAPPSGAVDRVKQGWASDGPQADPLWRTTTQSVVRLKVPLGPQFPAHPGACDWISYLRFRSTQGPSDATKADAVYVAMPGIFEGASAFDIVARNMIGRAEQAGKHIEVWAIDRRANCLEDRTGLEAGVRAKDLNLLIDYYFNGKVIDGRTHANTTGDTPETFREDLRGNDAFLTQLGIEQTLKDYYAVIADGFPDAAMRKQKVVCGGHSLGGVLSGLFSAWDFDGNRATTDDAGYNNCAGFLELDTLTVSRVNGIGNGLTQVLSALTGGARYPSMASYITMPVINPEIMRVLDGAAANAYWFGDAETTLQHKLPLTRKVREALRVVFSQNLAAFARGGSHPDLTEIRLTANALFGFLLDDNSFNVASIAQVSMGYPNGGPLARKDFPIPSSLVAIPALRTLTDNLGGAGRLVLPTPNQPTGPNSPLYGWTPYNQIKPVRYTDPSREVADMRQVARSFFEAPTDFIEMYMPTRIGVESMGAVLGYRSNRLAKHLLWDDAARRKPALNVLAGNGPARTALPFVTAPGRTIVVPGYTHLDPLLAAPIQNDGQPEIGSAAAAAFMGTIAETAK